jgi:hypothetical protein
MPRFQPGHHSTGRPKGSRNRLSGDFIKALADEFEAHGAEAIRICRIEEPATFLKIVASLMPKEIDITTTAIQEIDDSELDRLIEYAREQLNAPNRFKLIGPIGSTIDGEKEKISRE